MAQLRSGGRSSLLVLWLQQLRILDAGSEFTLLPNTTNLNSPGMQPWHPDGTLRSSVYLIQMGETACAESCGRACASWRNASAPLKRCRTFTWIRDDYKPQGVHDPPALPLNQSRQCYGHADPVWLPLRDLRMNSGEVNHPCTSDLDCSLNGKCADGACHCITAWTGHRCETLRLLPVDKSKMGFQPMESGRNMSSWGGSAVEVNGTWHMWAARMDNHCGIRAWVENSRIVHAVASDPLGPYLEQPDSVVPSFAHEPCVDRAPGGEFVMVSVQAPPDPAPLNRSKDFPIPKYWYNETCKCKCTSFTEPGACPLTPCDHPFIPVLNVATSPFGPWNATRLDRMGLGDANLAITILTNGSVVGMGRGGITSYAHQWWNASSWSSLSETQGGFVVKEDSEDPFPYQDDNGNFHALLHNLESPPSPMPGRIDRALLGIHAFSEDGIHWYDGGVAYTNHVEYTDGTSWHFDRRERPHLLFAEGTRTIVALSTSAEPGGPSGDRTFTLVQGVATASKLGSGEHDEGSKEHIAILI